MTRDGTDGMLAPRRRDTETRFTLLREFVAAAIMPETAFVQDESLDAPVE